MWVHDNLDDRCCDAKMKKICSFKFFLWPERKYQQNLFRGAAFRLLHETKTPQKCTLERGSVGFSSTVTLSVGFTVYMFRLNTAQHFNGATIVYKV